ncbi:hypothetical protein HMPREF0201_01935 [Cedecea davisae DSM 4568]|uniref:Uncharacterized protein n=1 Tax=Cedecea davisae DSM 4568 TaxID=566551 RepID=S3IV26_9ENTR|nr:hypothetical protein HMPREF0201_01935 [Cedecea davisae DSM 4568]
MIIHVANYKLNEWRKKWANKKLRIFARKLPEWHRENHQTMDFFHFMGFHFFVFLFVNHYVIGFYFIWK